MNQKSPLHLCLQPYPRATASFFKDSIHGALMEPTIRYLDDHDTNGLLEHHLTHEANDKHAPRSG